ncbi:AAA family ATPase [uncultured Thiodictyon sp.]|uniref:McrB family protein n=1 Tax=uncultured Thiodictyon sp. TaxID=1846217 RepID=UPI0025D9B780|nr:AAA family ATPase [uncultured Thiodictyon sp.]
MDQYRNEFYKQIKDHDLLRVFADLDGRSTAAVLDEIRASASKVFGPLEGSFGDGHWWIGDNWDKGKTYGYDFADTTGARTALDCPRVLQSLGEVDLSKSTFTWLFSSGHRHWNFAQSKGLGIKSILADGAFPEYGADQLSTYRDRLNAAIGGIAGFQPGAEDCEAFRTRLRDAHGWKECPNLSVPFHLVWPQFFPVQYMTTSYGYSQVAGMGRLLKDLVFKLGLRLCPLEFDRYAYYSAAYRVLLTAYDAFVWPAAGEPRNTSHFDFLTELLAADEDVEARQLLVMKKSLVLYGVPGTSKTHIAQEELLPALVPKENWCRVQFHTGYSYADFIIGIRPRSVNGAISYSVEPGILYRLAAEAALAQPDTDSGQPQPYALLIDEINRADLARVFGEVLYCIEYRNAEGKDHSIRLPHTLAQNSQIISVLSGKRLPQDPFSGGEKFYLPENLYLVGTMNQADRSIGSFDAALRRRFAWYRLDFSRTRLRQMLLEKFENAGVKVKEDQIVSFVERAAALNGKIAAGQKDTGLPLSAEHALGHTYFAELVGIMQSTGHRDGQIDAALHLKRLWLYFLGPLLEDALGFEAPLYQQELAKLRDSFIEHL